MKQIKKLIFNIVIKIMFATMLFFAWQKLVRKTRDTNEVKSERGDTNEVKRERGDTNEVKRERGDTNEVKSERGDTYIDSYQYDSPPIKKWRAWDE